MAHLQPLKSFYAKLFFNSLFTIVLVSTWQISSIEQVVFAQRQLSSLDEDVKLEECSIGTKQALEKNVSVVKIAQILSQSRQEITSIQCVKWIEKNQILYITLHSLKDIMEKETALLSLFEGAISVQTKPLGSYQNLLGEGILPLNHNEKSTSLVFETLNQDQRPEIIFLANIGRFGALFAFEMNLAEKRLEVIEFDQEIAGESVTDDFVAIDNKNVPSIEFEKTSSGTIIKTPNTRFSVNKDKWIKQSLHQAFNQ